MSLDLYYAPPAAPSRSVLFVGKELDIKFNHKVVDLFLGEQLKPDFVAINPQHVVPTLVDNEENGFVLWESRSIMKYLVDKLSPGHSLYPTDLKIRATIDRWLYFDIGSLYPEVRNILVTVLLHCLPLDESQVPPLERKLRVYDDALKGKDYLVSSHRTIADLSMLATVTTLEVVDGLDLSEFENITKWATGLKQEMPYYNEINEAGLDMIRAGINRNNK